MKIGDLFLALGVTDTAAFRASVTKEAEAAGKAGSSKFSSTFATGLKVGSVIVGAAFGLMTKGAIEMEKSQGRFQAATGRSRDEAIAFSKDMNSLVGSAKTVGQSFDEISETGIAVAQQFGITGDEARDLTEDILGFAKVTGQDASDAALQLEDTLSAFGLSADDAAGFMDTLVASSQKFGTDAGPAQLELLQKMAPALTAMGMGLDDAVALLNDFEKAGVRGADAQRGLNSAITNLPPGTTMEEFLQHLQDLKNQGIDPTSEAIDVFGNKAGAALALTIKPGGHALDDFRVSAEEAAGAVDKAADDMLTTNDKIRMFTEKAGAALRGLGQDFGPLVSGLGAIGSLAVPFAKSLTGLFGGLAKSGPIKAAASAAGSAASAAYSAGMKVLGAITDLLSSAWTAIRNSGPAKVVIGAAGAAAAAAYSAGMKVVDAITGALSSAWQALKNSAPVKAAAAAVGAVTGAAQAAAHETAATGVGVVKSLAARIAAMSIPLAASGTTVGTAVGGAMAAGVTVGWLAAIAGAGLAVHLGPQLLLEKLTGTDEEGRIRGASMAFAVAEGFADQGGKLGDVVVAAIVAAKAAGATSQAAYEAGDAAGRAYLDGLKVQTDAIGPVIIGSIDQSASQWVPIGESIGEPVGEGVSEGTAHGIVHSSGTVSEAYRDMLDVAFVDAYRESQAAATELGAGLPGSVGDAIYDHATEAISGIEHLRDVLENGLTPRQIALEAMGAKYIKDVRKGMESEIPGARQTAQQVAGEAIEAIEEAGLNGTKGQKGLKRQGEYYIELLNSGMTSMEARAFLTGQGVSDKTIDGLESKYPAFVTTGETAAGKVHTGFNNQPWSSWGSGSAGEWISGFVNGISHKQDFIERKLDFIFKGNSPPRVAPNIDKHGFKTGQLWAEALGKGAAMLGLDMFKPIFSMPAMTGHSTMELHHTVDIRGDAGVLDERKVADYLNEGAAGFAWNLEHAMSAVNSG